MRPAGDGAIRPYDAMNEHPNNSTLLVAGLGNIGSHFVSEMAKVPIPVTRVVFIDPDLYEESNLAGQAIDRGDLGKPKVEAQAGKLGRARPDLRIDTHVTALEAVPFGVYRGADVIVSGLDSRRARAALNDRVYRTGLARWIDGGVSPDAGLARVTMLQGGHNAPCLECDWTDTDYAALEQRYLCGGKNEASPTAASAELGRLAAAGMLAALRSILSDRGAVVHRETLLRLDGGSALETRLPRHAACRFHHLMDPLPDFAHRVELDLPIETLFERFAPGASVGIAVHGAGRWIHEVACTGCGRPAERCLCLENRLGDGKCSHCGSANLMPVGFKSQPLLWRNDPGGKHLVDSLRTAGVRPGDEITFYHDRSRPQALFRLALES
jgi:molybdopterin/thiamine biosynthesis adenylyltransferase